MYRFETVFNVKILVDPVAKGRPRFTRAGRCYTPAATKHYEVQLKEALNRAWGLPVIEDTPLRLEILFHVKRPQKKRDYPTTRPDTDNLLKAVMDAMNGVIVKDDALFCDIEAKKRYAEFEPFIELTIFRLDSIYREG